MLSRLPHDVEAIIAILALVVFVVARINLIIGLICAAVWLILSTLLYFYYRRW